MKAKISLILIMSLILFIMGIIVPSILEYFTGWLMEVIFKTTWWDYSNYNFNIK